jgi:hypothetical protein
MGGTMAFNVIELCQVGTCRGTKGARAVAGVRR